MYIELLTCSLIAIAISIWFFKQLLKDEYKKEKLFKELWEVTTLRDKLIRDSRDPTLSDEERILITENIDYCNTKINVIYDCLDDLNRK